MQSEKKETNIPLTNTICVVLQHSSASVSHCFSAFTSNLPYNHTVSLHLNNSSIIYFILLPCQAKGKLRRNAACCDTSLILSLSIYLSIYTHTHTHTQYFHTVRYRTCVIHLTSFSIFWRAIPFCAVLPQMFSSTDSDWPLRQSMSKLSL